MKRSNFEMEQEFNDNHMRVDFKTVERKSRLKFLQASILGILDESTRYLRRMISTRCLFKAEINV